MGRFSNKVSQETKATRSVIKINPYELPERALAIVANICSMHNVDEASVVFNQLYEEFEKPIKDYTNFWEFIEDNRKDLFYIDFSNSLVNLLNDLNTELQAHENTSDTQIVVAGGFSAGKSSFLNAITGASNLLPTGIEPVSMVATYLYCSDKVTDVVVKGVNLREAVVLLDRDVLQSIQHESASKVYLASVLSKLFVEIPSKELNGFVFIDTPGYNNSDKKNEANNSTDEQTAISALNSGNVLLWVVDAGCGTVPNRDKKIIDEYLAKDEGRKAVILFNKADKKGNEEIRLIVDETAKLFAPYCDKIVDILGYSSFENKIYYSRNNYTMEQLLSALRKCGNGNSGANKILEEIDELFLTEYNFLKFSKEAYCEERKEFLANQNATYKQLGTEKNITKNIVESLTDSLMTSYNSVLKGAEKYANLAGTAIDALANFHNAVNNWNNTEHVCFEDTLGPIINRNITVYNNLSNKYNSIRYTYWKESDRKTLLNNIRSSLDTMDEQIKQNYELFGREVDKKNEEIKKLDQIIEIFKDYRGRINDILRISINKFQTSSRRVQDCRLPISISDIFTTIEKNNLSEFKLCFANGVNMEQCSSEGYSPFTYAVKVGNLEMVKFFIEHNADPLTLDNRGLNTLHTAIENERTEISQFLVEKCPDLIYSKSANGDDIKNLKRGNKFQDWLNNI